MVNSYMVIVASNHPLSLLLLMVQHRIYLLHGILYDLQCVNGFPRQNIGLVDLGKFDFLLLEISVKGGLVSNRGILNFQRVLYLCFFDFTVFLYEGDCVRNLLYGVPCSINFGLG